jgi:hypothetical protein
MIANKKQQCPVKPSKQWQKDAQETYLDCQFVSLSYEISINIVVEMISPSYII